MNLENFANRVVNQQTYDKLIGTTPYKESTQTILATIGLDFNKKISSKFKILIFQIWLLQNNIF